MSDEFFKDVANRILVEVVEGIEGKGFLPLTEREQKLISEVATVAVIAFIRITNEDVPDGSPSSKAVN